jgi:hypothetical protein
MQITTSQSRLQSGKRRQMAVTEWAVRVTNQTAMKILHELVADKLERDPALLRIPLENIDRYGTERFARLNRHKTTQKSAEINKTSDITIILLFVGLRVSLLESNFA